MPPSLTFTLIIPLIPLYSIDEPIYDYINDTIAEILTFSDILEIELIEPDRKLKTKIELLTDYKSPFTEHPSTFRALSFSVTIQRDLKKPVKWRVFNSKSPMTQEDLMELFIASAKFNFGSEIRNFLLLSQIARPATIKTAEWEFQGNGRTLSSLPCFGSIHRESLDVVFRLKWPAYINISIADVITWFRSNKFSFNRFSRNNTERALNAFTYLFPYERRTTEEHDLLYTMLGIESLYCSVKKGIVAQIDQKAQALLGPLSGSKRMIRKLYDFRSRFYHGDRDIAPDGYHADDVDERLYDKALFEALSLGVFILTVTFQLMVKNGWKELPTQKTIKIFKKAHK